MKLITVLFCVCAGLALAQCQSMQKVKIRASKDECKAEHKVTYDDVRRGFLNHSELTRDVKCYLACFMKKIEMMDNSGKLDAAKSRAFAETLTKGEDLDALILVINWCGALEVNSDHCEAAGTYVNCITTGTRYIEQSF